MQIVYPIIALLISTAIAWWVYRADKKRSVPYPWLTASIRGVIIMLVLLLLLTPSISITKTETRKPIIVFLQDNSVSIAHALGKDSNTYKANATKLINQLSDKYQVVKWGFGNRIQTDSLFDYHQNGTDISDAMSKVQEYYGTQNLGAVILATDGRFNQGANPLYLQSTASCPLYTVGIGDSSVQKDIRIAQVYCNKSVALNSKFEIRADILANICKGYTNSIQLTENGNLIATTPLAVNTDRYDRSVSFTIPATRAGLHHYTISAPAADNEANIANNRKDVFVEVTEEQKHILIIAAAPHPDIYALKDALSGIAGYKITTRMMDDLPPTINEYSVVILHQCPTINAYLFNQLRTNTKPVWFILGAQSNPALLNGFKAPAALNIVPGSTKEAVSEADPAFNLFTLPANLPAVADKMPPLNVPNGTIQSVPGTYTLFKQRRDGTPLWTLQQGSTPTALLAGEGIWRWRLYEYKNFGTHEVVDECIRQTISFLTANSKEKPFRAYLPKYIWTDQEPVNINAYLLNANNEQVNTAHAELVITDSSGRKQNYSFEKAGTAYRLNLGVWAAGTYNYIAKTSYNGTNYTSTGSFVVEAQPVELMETGGDHKLLYSLAHKYNGAFVPAASIAGLYDTISKNSDIKPVIETNIETEPLIDWKWYFFLILLFATAEWLLRKYWLAQ